MPETDILKVNNLIVKKDATIGGSLEVAGPLILPEGAALDYVLKSDADGLATWQENTLAGDITGNTTAAVQHHKWIGNWDALVPYQKYNRVTHDHVEYRALFDNMGTSPSTTIGSYSRLALTVTGAAAAGQRTDNQRHSAHAARHWDSGPNSSHTKSSQCGRWQWLSLALGRRWLRAEWRRAAE